MRDVSATVIAHSCTEAVIDMDQVDDGIICSSRRTIASSVNTIVSGNGENRSEGDDGGENAFYGRAYDGLGGVF